MRYDLHIHTYKSPCSVNKPKEILKNAEERKLDGIAICDHNTIEGAMEVKEISKDIDVIVGEEVTTDKGEILVYYLEKEIKPGKFEEVLEEARKQNAIVSVAHPYSIGIRKKAKIDFSKVDAIEGFNGRVFFKFQNTRAKIKAKELNKAVLGGSDAHFPNEIGKVVTIFEGDLRTAVKNKKIRTTGRIGFSLPGRLLSLVIKIFKKYKNKKES